VGGLLGAIYARLAVPPGDTYESVCRAGCADSKLHLLGLRLAVKALAGSGSRTDRERGAAIERWLALDVDARAGEFDDYCGQYLRADGRPRVRLITVAAGAANPGVEDILQSEAERLLDLRDRCNAAIIANATRGLLRLGAEMLKSYEEHKKARSLLDY